MISGYMNSTPFPVYNFGEIVMNRMIPPEPHSDPSSFYIKWRPSYIRSGTFVVSGVTYNFSDYRSGIFWFDSSCSGYWDDRSYYSGQVVINPGIRNNPYVTYFETNLLVINTVGPSGLFQNLPNLSMVSMSCCRRFGGRASPGTFESCGSPSVYMNVYLPECLSIWTEAFVNDVYISNIYLPVCNNLALDTFSQSITITLLGSSVVTVGGGDTPGWRLPIRGFEPYDDLYIYVPSSLVGAYKLMSGTWWWYKSRIFPIPE